MKKLLIIRSVSFQQLDMNIVAIQHQFPDYRLNLLTHEHGVKLAEKYKMIDKVYVYPHKSGFQWGKRVLELQSEYFDAVIIPVTNISGNGFLNVLLYSLMLKTKRRYICNLISEIKGITSSKIILNGLENTVFSVLSLIAVAVFILPVHLILPFKLKRIEKKSY